MSKQINIGGRIHSTEVGNVAVGTNEVLDDTKGKKQNVINSEVGAELLRLDQSKQDNLTFDNTPTENSTNPVKSGGVYAADKALSDAIEAILILIPSAATALNQLADKNFVNSSIATDTATFRGTSATGLSEAQFLEWANSLTHDMNDYVFWQTIDEAGNTLFKRYKWNGTQWLYEYTLNNSSFTADQWAAIMSGITSALVGKLRDLPTAAQLIASFEGKQDVLTFDNVPVQGSGNPVKSGGVYSAIKDVTDLIPAEATNLNQLADKAYVLAQILAATPAFKGQFETLVELQAVQSPKAGDLGIVRTKDSDGYDVFTFYQYLNNQWNVFYTLSHHLLNKPASTGTTGAYPYNGMGRVVIPKKMVNGVNTLTHEAFEDAEGNDRENTVYVIQYDFTLGDNINVPDNCILEFDGGSISGNGIGKDTITGTNSRFTGTMNGVFDNISFAGSFNCPEVDTDWFRDLSAVNAIRKIQPLISNSNKKSIYLRDKGYNYILDLSSSMIGLRLYSNTKIFSNATFIVNTNSRDDYRIFFILGKENITIDGGKFVGDIDTHGNSGSASEQCQGIAVFDSSNITIKNIESCYFPGDGIYLGKLEDNGSSRCQIENVYIHHCGRNGISLAKCEDAIVRNSVIEYICMKEYIGYDGPGAAIDIEPNQGEFADNILLKNISIQKCGNGINIYGRNNDDNRVKKVILKNINIKNILGTDTYEHYGMHIFSQCDYLNAENVSIIQNESGLGNSSLIDLQYTTSYFNNLFINCDITTSSFAIRSTHPTKKCSIVNSTIISKGTLFNPKLGNYYVYNCDLKGTLFTGFDDTSRATEMNLINSTISCGTIAGWTSLFSASNCKFIYTGGSLSFIYIDTINNIKKLSIKDCVFSREANMSEDNAYILISKVGDGVIEISNNIFDLDTTTYTYGRGIRYNSNTLNKNVYGYNNVFINVPQGLANSRKIWNQSSNVQIFEFMQALYDADQKEPCTTGIQQFRNGKPVWYDSNMGWVDALGNSVNTVYPKVIGTPTTGNLAKFNGNNIEDAGVAPQS